MKGSRVFVVVLAGVLLALVLSGYVAVRATFAQEQGAAAQPAAEQAAPAPDVLIVQDFSGPAQVIYKTGR